MEGHDGMCGCTHHGIMKIAWGALLLLNGFVWPLWTGIDGWIKYIAVILVLVGISKLIWPSCGHCIASMGKRK